MPRTNSPFPPVGDGVIEAEVIEPLLSYYTITQVNALLASKAPLVHTHALGDLSNVNAPSPNNGDRLAWNTATQRWIPLAGSGGGGASDVGDLTAAGYSANDFAQWDGATFLPVAAYTQSEVDALLTGYSETSHTHTFASLTSIPTTVAGYGISDVYTVSEIDVLIADFLTQAETDALYSALAHTHTFASLTSKPTTLTGYGITDALSTSAVVGDLADVTITTPSTNQVLTYNGTIWVNQDASGGGASDIGDLTATGYSTDQSPRWNGSEFAPADYYTETEVDALLTGYSQTSHTHTFASLTSTPTTLSGYGITDALALAGGTMTGAIALAAGAVTTPSLSFGGASADTNTGFYWVADGRIGVSANGVQIAEFNGTSVQVAVTGLLSVSNPFSTSAVTDLAVFTGTSTATPAANSGIGFLFRQKSSTSNAQTVGQLQFPWQTATHASRSPYGVFYLTDFGGQREIWRGWATGSAAAIGFLGATPAVRQTGGAATAGGTYTATEQAMIQAAYDALRTFGLLT